MDATVKIKRDEHGSIRGIILPTGWSQDGAVTELSVMTSDEGEIRINKDSWWEELLSVMRKDVELFGAIEYPEAGKKTITVHYYELVK